MFEFESALFVFNSSLKSKLGIPNSVILQEKKEYIEHVENTTCSEEDFKGFHHIWAGGHLGHVTSIMSSNFHFLVLESFLTKFGSELHSSF